MSGTNYSIYEERLTAAHPSAHFDYVPRCLYFYYMRPEADRLRVDHYFYSNGPLHNPGLWNPIAIDDVESLLARLVANARSSGGQDPPISGDSFRNVVWTYKSHMALVVDAPGWAFRKRGNGTGAVAFNVGKGSTPNHSFFDGQDLDVRVPREGGGEDLVSGAAFINHMKRNSAGDDLGHESQDFTFDAYFEVGYAGADAPPAVFILDPGGTNQGPPQSP